MWSNKRSERSFHAVDMVEVHGIIFGTVANDDKQTQGKASVDNLTDDSRRYVLLSCVYMCVCCLDGRLEDVCTLVMCVCVCVFAYVYVCC
jgi:hypothetical protein